MLKDRDLSGELKDIWGAVQAKREREKDAAPSYEHYLASQNQIYAEFGPETARQTVPPTDDSIQKEQNDCDTEYQVDVEVKVESPNEKTNEIDESDSNNGNTSPIDVEPVPMTMPTAIDCESNGKVNDTMTNDSVTQSPTKKDEQSKSKSNNNSSTVTPAQATTTKKEKLGGFLPNSCHNIFPFIKSKSQEKKSNKDKEKAEKKSEKEENRTNLKKSMKEHNNSTEGSLANATIVKSLESEISKLDLNKSMQEQQQSKKVCGIWSMAVVNRSETKLIDCPWDTLPLPIFLSCRHSILSPQQHNNSKWLIRRIEVEQSFSRKRNCQTCNHFSSKTERTFNFFLH